MAWSTCTASWQRNGWNLCCGKGKITVGTKNPMFGPHLYNIFRYYTSVIYFKFLSLSYIYIYTLVCDSSMIIRHLQ